MRDPADIAKIEEQAREIAELRRKLDEARTRAVVLETAFRELRREMDRASDDGSWWYIDKIDDAMRGIGLDPEQSAEPHT